MDDQPYDLVIVGLGPVGAAAANLAGVHGLRCLAIDLSDEVFALPRAIHFDAEVMRILQYARLSEEVEPLTRPSTGSVHLGMDHEPIRRFLVPPGPGDLGWRPHYMFYQPELDALLRRRAAERVELRTGWTCTGFTQHDEGVTVRLRSASGEERAVQSAYLLGCDGASSSVRRQLRAPLFDFGFEEPWIIVDTLVSNADLGPDNMIMYCDPNRPGTYVPGPGRHRRWEFMLLEGDDHDELQTPDGLRRLIQPITDWAAVSDMEIVRSAIYRFHGLVGRRWWEGRVFLAGDAVHQTPPFYAQGMCHGIRDVHNFLWKLALVHRGGATASLLESYQEEREPHVRAIIAAAIENGRYICTLDPAQAAARDAGYRERLRAGTDVGSFRGVIPPLVSGLLDAPITAPVGQLLPQPVVDGSGLDDRLGRGFALVSAGELDRDRLPPWFTDEAVRGRVVTNVQALGPWFAEHGCEAALVRPDRYVFGVCTADDAGSLVERLGARLGTAGGTRIAA
jgi:3-(3-hydroxy-phenyl)propionate hydroxylase